MKDVLKSMLNNLINDKLEEAHLDLHSYVTSMMMRAIGVNEAMSPAEKLEMLDHMLKKMKPAKIVVSSNRRGTGIIYTIKQSLPDIQTFVYADHVGIDEVKKTVEFLKKHEGHPILFDLLGASKIDPAFDNILKGALDGAVFYKSASQDIKATTTSGVVIACTKELLSPAILNRAHVVDLSSVDESISEASVYDEYAPILKAHGFKKQASGKYYKTTGAGTISIDKHGHWQHDGVGEDREDQAYSDYEGTTANTLDRHLKKLFAMH